MVNKEMNKYGIKLNIYKAVCDPCSASRENTTRVHCDFEAQLADKRLFTRYDCECDYFIVTNGMYEI